jgi:hypothetical protein
LKAIASFYHKALAKSQEARAIWSLGDSLIRSSGAAFRLATLVGVSPPGSLFSSQQKELTERGLIRSSGKEFFHRLPGLSTLR